MGRFFDNSRGKIGKQKICNKFKFMDDLEVDWIDKEWTPDLIRRTLKKALSSSILTTLHKLQGQPNLILFINISAFIVTIIWFAAIRFLKRC